MGTYYAAVIAVGVQRRSIEDFSTVEELIDDGELRIFGGYAGGESEDDAVVGLTFDASDDYASTEFAWDQQKVDDLKEQFMQITGMEAKVWITPHGH